MFEMFKGNLRRFVHSQSFERLSYVNFRMKIMVVYVHEAPDHEGANWELLDSEILALQDILAGWCSAVGRKQHNTPYNRATQHKAALKLCSQEFLMCWHVAETVSNCIDVAYKDAALGLPVLSVALLRAQTPLSAPAPSLLTLSHTHT